MSHLDHFIVTSATVGWIEELDIKPGFRSDHSLIYMSLTPLSYIKVEALGNLMCVYWKTKSL